MDAYLIYQRIYQYWQQCLVKCDSASIKKDWHLVPVYVNGKIVTDVKIEDGKIILETE